MWETGSRVIGQQNQPKPPCEGPRLTAMPPWGTMAPSLRPAAAQLRESGLWYLLKAGKSGRKNSQSTLLLCEDNIGGTSGAKCWHRNQAVSNHRKHQSNNYTKQPEITTRTRLSVNSIGQAKKKKVREFYKSTHFTHWSLFKKLK